MTERKDGGWMTSELSEYIDQQLRIGFQKHCDENTAKVAQLLKDNPILCEKCNTPVEPCDGCAWAYWDGSPCPFSGTDPWICPNEMEHFKPVGILNQS